MRKPEIKSYAPPFELGKPITNSAVAKVLKSSNAKFKPGDTILGMLPTEQYSIVSPETANNIVRILDNPYGLDPTLFVGALGMPGLTSYSSFYDIGKPKKGETIFISSASGVGLSMCHYSFRSTQYLFPHRLMLPLTLFYRLSSSNTMKTETIYRL